MQTRLVCLANSYKEGGRCIAGIELDADNNPIIINEKPKWIRPVYNIDHGQIPTVIAEPFQLLHIIQLNITGIKPEGYQCENVTFDERSLLNIGNFSRDKLFDLCDKRSLIFGNQGKAVSQDSIQILNRSLMLVTTSQFEVTQVAYEDRPDKPKTRLIFNHASTRYDLPVTCPAFLRNYQQNNNLLIGTKQLLLTISLGIPLDNWYYKLVAGIIY